MRSFTAYAGRMTTARRLRPIAQLQCKGGPCELSPASMQCYNKGWDGKTVNWDCRADLDQRVRFGGVHVVCEGYDYAGDQYILAGSCGVGNICIRSSYINFLMEELLKGVTTH